MTCFSLRPQGGTVMIFWAYLAFKLTQKVFPTLTDLQVRSSGAACQNSKAFNYKFVVQNSSVKEYKC